MADRPNNFGEVLLKSIGSTAEEAPSIFNDAKTRKKAEALQMFHAMLQLQEARQNESQLKMQAAQQQQQAQVAQANMAHINAETAKLQYEMSQPYRDWTKEKEREMEILKTNENIRQQKALIDYYQQKGLTSTGNTPSGGGGQQLFTPDDLAKMADRKRSTLQSTYQGRIDNAMAGPETDAAIATYQPKIDELLTPTWMNANLANATDSLGVPPAMLSSAATTAPAQTQQQPSMTRAILEDAVKTGKLKKTDPQYTKWDKYFKARNQ